MPTYNYSAVDTLGRSRTGTMPAQDESNLELKLRGAGLWLVDATPAPYVARKKETLAGSDKGWMSWGAPKRRTLIEFCTLMGFQVRVGVTLVQALDVARQDCEDKRFRRVLAGLQHHIESGLLFCEALEKYPRTFSPHFISVMRAGETSSKLPETFEDLRDYLEWLDQIVADVRQASLYPAIVLMVILAFALFLFIFIIPKFAELLTSLKLPLPLLTQMIFGLGDFMKATWGVWLGVFLFLTIGIPVGCRLSRSFARIMDLIKLKMPIFGELNLMLAISRFSHNFSILYRSGIAVLQSLQLCRGLVGNVVVEDAVAAVQDDVKMGNTISEALRKQPIFPPLLLRMVVMGESTGGLDTALDHVSDYYNQVIPRRIKKIFTVLEPMLMLMLIGMVGAVALAIYLPLLALMGSIR